jgi:formate-dependent phosphoribosylglycinamide formyltransferase (GAR transformylase)
LKIQAIKKKTTHLCLPDSVLKKEILFVNSMESLIEASDVLGLPYSSDTSSSSSSSSSSSARVSEKMRITTNKLADVKKGKNQNVAVSIIDSNNNNY